MKIKKTVLFLALGITTFSYGQSLGRYSLNSFGNTVSKEGITVSQTAGQSGSFTVFKPTGAPEIRQGFQQSHQYAYASVNKDLEFKVYPNPNNGKFIVELKERFNGELQFSLYDAQGRMVHKEQTIVAQKMEFNYPLPTGVYTLYITDESGRTGITKIIILP